MRPRPRGAETGLLAPDAVDKALTSLRRFHALCKIQQVGRVYAIATAACRDASNGPDFIARAERICGSKIEILSGPREAKLSALGVISGIHKPDGIVGDLGGGSLELIDVRGHRVRSGVTLPLGSLALQDLSHKSLKRAERIVSTELVRSAAAQGRPRPHLLRGRRHLARAGAHPHHPERLSAQGDARLLDSGGRGARLRAAAAPAGGRQHARRYRGGGRSAAAAPDLCRARARIRHPHRAAEDHHVLDLRRARGPAVRDAAGGRARQGRVHLRRAGPERAVVALGAPCRGTDRVDRPPRRGSCSCARPRRTAGCATPPACCPTSAGACIPIIAASRRSTSSPTAISARSAIRAAPSSGCRCSSAMPGSQRGERAAAGHPGAGHPRHARSRHGAGRGLPRRASDLGGAARRVAGDAFPQPAAAS